LNLVVSLYGNNSLQTNINLVPTVDLLSMVAILPASSAFGANTFSSNRHLFAPLPCTFIRHILYLFVKQSAGEILGDVYQEAVFFTERCVP
jgi:hypothetical protein